MNVNINNLCSLHCVCVSSFNIFMSLSNKCLICVATLTIESFSARHATYNRGCNMIQSIVFKRRKFYFIWDDEIEDKSINCGESSLTLDTSNHFNNTFAQKKLIFNFVKHVSINGSCEIVLN